MLLNIRPLFRHALELAIDINLIDKRTLLRRKQLLDFSSFDNIQSSFQGHLMQSHNDRVDKVKSLKLLKKNGHKII